MLFWSVHFQYSNRDDRNAVCVSPGDLSAFATRLVFSLRRNFLENESRGPSTRKFFFLEVLDSEHIQVKTACSPV